MWKIITRYSYFQIAVADEQRLSATYDFEEVLNTVVSIENDDEVEPELRKLCEQMRKQVFEFCIFSFSLSKKYFLGALRCDRVSETESQPKADQNTEQNHGSILDLPATKIKAAHPGVTAVRKKVRDTYRICSGTGRYKSKSNCKSWSYKILFQTSECRLFRKNHKQA